jgi:hypothetical protein
MTRSKIAAAALVLAVGGTGLGLGDAAATGVAAANPIVRENALAGTPGWGEGEWQDSRIEGYASETSVQSGDALHLHVSTPAGVDYRIEVFRLGWYSGVGARRVSCIPSCSTYRSGAEYGAPWPNSATGEVDASWPTTDEFVIPTGWVSGYYLAELVPSDGDARGIVPFVVREASDHDSAILVDVPVNTWEAYNAWGGKSLYDFNSTDSAPATHVSFNRPYLWEAPGSQAVSKWELPLVRFLEHEGYDVSYATDGDIDHDPRLLLRHRVVVVNGHGEYWTRSMRDAFESAEAAGTNMAFMGANISYWQVRYERAGRTMVGYKASPDPNPDAALKTTLFRDLSPPRPECSLLGVQHYTGSYQWPRGDYQVEAATDPWFADTGLDGSSFVEGVVSREHDQIPEGSRAGESCGRKVVVLFRHVGSIPLERAEAVRYTDAASGAQVFSAGSHEFAWALDGLRVGEDGSETPVDPRIRQFTRNMLADLLRLAPPQAVAVRIVKGTRHVSVRSVDPRITSVLVFRHGGSGVFAPGDSGVLEVCRAAGRECSDSARLRAGVYRYAAVAIDPWGQSAARLSAPVSITQMPKPNAKAKKAKPGRHSRRRPGQPIFR